MKEPWNKLWKLWAEEREGDITVRLSGKDRGALLFGAFFISVLTVILTLAVCSITVARMNRQTEEEVSWLVDSVTAYLAAATDDEYTRIAEQLRDDLILSPYSHNIEELASRIPNSADGCCAEQLPHTAQVYLVCTNTGEMYPLDTGGADMGFAYDEISERNAYIMVGPDENSAAVTFSQGRGIVSVHRMKGLFCDSCIHKLLGAVENTLMPEFALLDPASMDYYPISEGTQTIGSYVLTVSYDSQGYALKLEKNKG